MTRILPRVTATTSQSAEDVPTRVDGIPAEGASGAAAGTDLTTCPGDDTPPELPSPAPTRSPAPKWRQVAIGAVAVFVTVMAVITGIELVAGRPLSDLVRGDQGKGTSLFGNEQVRTRTTTVPADRPHGLQDGDPEGRRHHPHVTQTAPAVTKTNPAPSSSPAGSQSAPTGTATATPTPTRTPTP